MLYSNFLWTERLQAGRKLIKMKEVLKRPIKAQEINKKQKQNLTSLKEFLKFIRFTRPLPPQDYITLVRTVEMTLQPVRLSAGQGERSRAPTLTSHHPRCNALLWIQLLLNGLCSGKKPLPVCP